MSMKYKGPSDKNKMVSDNSDLQGQNTSGDYPDFNTPLNAEKAGPDPQADVLNPVNPWDTGGEPADPNEFVGHLELGRGAKEGRNRKH